MRFWKFLGLLGALLSTAAGSDLLIQNVTVVDVATGAERPNQWVAIHNERIIHAGARIPTPKTARIVNGEGKYLIPGLWDMHVHLWYRENQFPLFIANGVTGLRDMGSDLNWLNQWREQVMKGKLLGPRIETCGPAVDGRLSADHKLPVFVVQGPVEARAVFDRLDDLDVDFIKVLSSVPRDAYFALIERARKYYVPVAGHIPESVSLMEAADARQRSVEHMSGTLLACSRQEDRLRSRILLAGEKGDRNALLELHMQVLDTFDPAKAQRLFERMSIYQVREDPTLVMLRRSLLGETDTTSSNLQYVPAAIRRDWADEGPPVKPSPQVAEIAKAEYEKLRSLVPAMRKSGIMIMAGTDTGDPYTYPGFDLHRELQLLVDAGLSPLEALRSATLEPAKYLDAEDALGTVEKGHLADLVLLDADPLKDIRNTQKIAAVFVDGKYLPKVQLNAMLAGMRRK